MDSAKNGRWIIPFQEFGMIRVNNKTYDRSFSYYSCLYIVIFYSPYFYPVPNSMTSNFIYTFVLTLKYVVPVYRLNQLLDIHIRKQDRSQSGVRAYDPYVEW